ncbi:MAG: serine dehydratase subunit alpha family protein [Oscillospiraceae bacterium]|nr:serine dehydratase subunit alpha family protein [Oscillospiraceae bacterium]
MDHREITELLKKEIAPATGCTGPTAYALASSCCARYMTARAERISVAVSPAYLKMGFGVATPGTTRTGIEIATAAGLTGGDPDAGMQVLKGITKEQLLEAEKIADSGIISVRGEPGRRGVYVRTEIVTANETVSAVVENTHDGISSVCLDGEPVFEAPAVYEEKRIEDEPERLTLEDVLSYAEEASFEEIGFLLDGYRMNVELAEDALKNEFGLGSGRALLLRSFAGREVPNNIWDDPMKYLPTDLHARAGILVAAASDARMGGSKKPAMAAMGDGNQGITMLIPIGVAGELMGKSEFVTARAMALGSLMLFYVKKNIGRAAATCLCAIAASAGAAAGYGFLLGLDEPAVKAAVKNVMSALAGMICDGAKNGCALKMHVACMSALSFTELAGYGVETGFHDGISDTTLEDAVRNITGIANETMDKTDACIVDVILSKTERDLGRIEE